MTTDHTKLLVLVSQKGDELPLFSSEFRLDFEQTTFKQIKEFIKDTYTGTTRLTDSDIGFFYNKKCVLAFPPMKLASKYNLTDDSNLADLFPESDEDRFELELAINVDGFFRNYEPIFTGGLLRSEGQGFISNLLNDDYGVSSQGEIQINDDISSHESDRQEEEIEEEESEDDDGESEKEKESQIKPITKNKVITPRIQFIDSITNNRIKILSDINEDAFVLVEIEDPINSTTRKGYLPRKNFEKISKFVLSFTPKYSHTLETITFENSKIKDTVSFKNDLLFLDKQVLMENGVLSLKEIQKLKRINNNISNNNNIILNSQQNDDLSSERSNNMMDDLRVIFNPRPAFIESFLSFLGVFFKTLYLIMKHSILASFVLFQLANFIPIHYALSLVGLNLLFTLLTDKEIKRSWEEFFRSFKMFEKDYNDLLNMVLEYKHIPFHILIQLEDNLLVRDYLSDSIRNSQDFKLLELLYEMIEKDSLAFEVDLEELKIFIQNSQLPKRIMTYPYQTIDDESHLMLAEPLLENTCLDTFVEIFLKILKQRFNKRCLKNNELFTETNTKNLNIFLLREAKNMLKDKYKIYFDFQKPLFDLIVEDLNFWKINNIHLKKNNVMRWNVDLENNNNNNNDDDNNNNEVSNQNLIIEETTRIDSDLYSMLEMILKAIRDPSQLLLFRKHQSMKDPFFKYNYKDDNYVVSLNGGKDKVFYKDGEIQNIVFTSNNYRNIEESRFNIFENLLTVRNAMVFWKTLLGPLKMVQLIIVWNYRFYKFLCSIFLIGTERWFEILKENMIDGDILYNFVSVDETAADDGLVKLFFLFWFIIIPAYQEKLHTIMNERDHFYEQLEKFIAAKEEKQREEEEERKEQQEREERELKKKEQETKDTEKKEEEDSEENDIKIDLDEETKEKVENDVKKEEEEENKEDKDIKDEKKDLQIKDLDINNSEILN